MNPTTTNAQKKSDVHVGPKVTTPYSLMKHYRFTNPGPTMTTTDKPSVETLSAVIFAHAIQGNLHGLRKVKPSEHKVLCYQYMQGTSQSSNCSHWIKPGDYVEQFMPVIDNAFFSHLDTPPTSAKATAKAIENVGENVPQCLACVCDQYAENILRKLDRWIDLNIGRYPESGGPQNRYVEDIIHSEGKQMRELLSGNLIPYSACQTEWACDFDPLNSESFEQWSTVIWDKWYEASMVKVLLSKRGRTGSEIWDGQDDAFWSQIIIELNQHASNRQSEYLKWQQTFFQGSKTNKQIQAEATILLSALKHFEPPTSVLTHLHSIVLDVPESFTQLTK